VYRATSSASSNDTVNSSDRRGSSSRDYRSDLLLVDWVIIVGSGFLFEFDPTNRLRQVNQVCILLVVEGV